MVISVLWLCAVAGAAPPSVHLTLNGQPIVIDPSPVVIAPDDSPPDASADVASVFVDALGFAQVVGMTAKIVEPGKLIVLCRGEKCYPVRLTSSDVRTVDNRSLVLLDRLARGVGLKMATGRDGRTVTVALSHTHGSKPGTTPVGALLPDVVLKDLAGKDVHLTQFLGRRLLICTWASW